MTRNINISSLALIVLLSGSCIHFARTPELSIERYKGILADSAKMYCEFYISDFDQVKRCYPLIFFPNGTLLKGNGIDLSENPQWFSSDEDLYEKSSYLGWGRYYTQNDTTHFEYIKYFNLGGSPHLPKISMFAVEIGKDSLLVMPTYYHDDTPYLGGNEIQIYVRTEYPDIHNINPEKAWINRE
jgi:hypothetical protein